MATDSYWQLEKEYYILTENHDLIIRVIEREKVTRTEGFNQRRVTELVNKKVHELKVKRDVLLNAAVYFTTLLDGKFMESGNSVVDLKEDSAAAAQAVIIWFKILHGSDLKSTYRTADLRVIWEFLAAGHRYGLDPTKSEDARNWFKEWYAANEANANWKDVGGVKFDFADHQALLFPCHTFDHPYGFAATTKYLVYHATGHITERRPEGFTDDNLRLDQSIIQQLNAAKGRLKTILHRALYTPIEKLLKDATCACKEKTLYAYEKALTDTGAWPLESAYLKQSMSEILAKLAEFPAATENPSCGDYHCRFDFADVVSAGTRETRSYFDGLCLDCMDASKPKFGDADEDYWRHAEHKRWDGRCRISHKQPTWYFSFMGRRQKMIEWQNRSRRRRYDDY